MTAIRKHLRDFVAIIVLLVVVADRRRRTSCPTSGSTCRPGSRCSARTSSTVNAEFSTAQAVTPGQGQTVNIAGVEVGEISSVKLENGRRSSA